MTLLITAPCQSGSLSLYWCGLSSGAAICLQNIATQYNTKNCRATKNIIDLSPGGWFMPQYPGSATLCSLQPVPIWPWSVPLRRKHEGLQSTKVTGWQHISSLTEKRLPGMSDWVMCVTLQMSGAYGGISNHWFIQQSHYTIIKVNITFHPRAALYNHNAPHSAWFATLTQKSIVWTLEHRNMALNIKYNLSLKGRVFKK